ncbi:hypothetical protein [Bremerella sp. P1]|uniref:hypothetical protein n=1 Tax=Bremerella sp. P1 TaxID=3026424 RepID=UPI0023675856|nr:hypothetical protein [Bremerella sp. P1]WDI41816.1 hypothetical protein PSR63_25525 [Bremerella sp. P1]
MAVAYESFTHTTAASTTSITGTKPSGTVEGDFLIAVHYSRNNDVQSTPSGWTEHSSNTAGFEKGHVYYKFAGGSEPASYTFSGSVSASNRWLLLMRFSGVASINDSYGITTIAGADGSDDYVFSAGTLTTTVDNCLNVYGGFGLLLASTITTPALTAISSGNKIGAGYNTQASAGSSVESKLRWNGGGSESGMVFALALAPPEPPDVFDETASGGADAGGTSTTSFVAYSVGAGGVVAAGEALIGGSVGEIASGGVVAGGTSLSTKVVNVTGEDGVVIGGSALVDGSQSVFASGGVVGGGIATVTSNQTIAVGGGVLCSGTATITVADFYQRTMITIPASVIDEDLNNFMFIVAFAFSGTTDNLKATNEGGDEIASLVRQYTGGVLHVQLQADLSSTADNIFYIKTGLST